MGTALILDIDAGDLDPDELDRLTRALRGELLELGAKDVDLVHAEDIPEGTKSAEAVMLGALAVTVLPAFLPTLVGYLQSWAARGENRRVRIKTLVGDRTIEVEYSPETFSTEELDRLVQTLAGSDGAPVVDDVRSILFLSADPINAPRLRLGEELRAIRETLQLARLRESFEVHDRSSVRPADISQSLLDLEPEIVHFSGHGATSGALCFEDQTGNAHPIPPDALSALFEQFSERVRCIVLNACYADAQANAIARHIPYVIGMKKALGDRAAIAFAVGFYQGLGAGRSIEEAYKLGHTQARLQGVPGDPIPILHKARTAD